MRKLSYVLMIMLTAWIFQACHSNTKNDTKARADSANTAKIDSTKKETMFDKAYVAEMVKDHKKDIKALKEAAKNCADPDIKYFTTKTLTVLKKHLDSINTIQDIMK